MKDFFVPLRNQPLWCSAQVQSRRAEGAGFESYRINFSFFFFLFFVLLFSINKQLNNCYLIKCNKQQEKYCVSRENIVHRILNIWINNLNFYYFLQFTVGKPELQPLDHFLNNVPTSSFYRLIVILFQYFPTCKWGIQCHFRFI